MAILNFDDALRLRRDIDASAALNVLNARLSASAWGFVGSVKMKRQQAWQYRQKKRGGMNAKKEGVVSNVLFIIAAPPYGSERVLAALRLATTLIHHETRPNVRLFFLSDGIVTGLAGQKIAEAISLGVILEDIIGAGGEVRVCRTCATARGLQNAAWLPKVQIGTMPELAEWTLGADRILTL